MLTQPYQNFALHRTSSQGKVWFPDGDGAHYCHPWQEYSGSIFVSEESCGDFLESVPESVTTKVIKLQLRLCHGFFILLQWFLAEGTTKAYVEGNISLSQQTGNICSRSVPQIANFISDTPQITEGVSSLTNVSHQWPPVSTAVSCWSVCPTQVRLRKATWVE